jgi:hypothetical protein
LSARYRRRHGVWRLQHPANSPDLNLIEGIWNIIKERVCRRLHKINTIDELKAVLQAEWKRVTQDQIQARINEMAWHVGEVFAHPEKHVKSDLW